MTTTEDPPVARPETPLGTAAASPLFREEWVEFNRRRWGVRAERVVLGNANGTPRLQTVVYRTRSGRILQPPRTVYVPVAFDTAPDTGVHRSSRQWAELSEELATWMAEAGIANTLYLSPDVSDVRAWQWQGLPASLKYTYHLDFPYDLGRANQSVRSRVKKAQKAGYACRRVDSVSDVVACLRETERRSGFDQQYSPEQLDEAQRFVGPEHFRCYVAYDRDGQPAAADIVLHNAGGWALAWMISTRTQHLPSGVTQLLHSYVVEDLQDAGAAGFDFVGAPMDSVGAAKASWGPRLVPCYSVQQYSPRRIAAYAFHGVRDMAARFSARRHRSSGPGSLPGR